MRISYDKTNTDSQENLIKLENRLLLFDMNISRKSSDILKEQDNLYNDNNIV